MIKEIRIGMDDVLTCPIDWNLMSILKEKGCPVEGTLELKPRTGLIYYEFHDHKTDEIVIQWEE